MIITAWIDFVRTAKSVLTGAYYAKGRPKSIAKAMIIVSIVAILIGIVGGIAAGLESAFPIMKQYSLYRLVRSVCCMISCRHQCSPSSAPFLYHHCFCCCCLITGDWSRVYHCCFCLFDLFTCSDQFNLQADPNELRNDASNLCDWLRIHLLDNSRNSVDCY